RLLRVINSSLYGFAKKIETVSHAVSLLGTQHIHDLVLATSVAQAFEDISIDTLDIQRFWQQSIYCAVSSRQLAGLCNGADKERLFVAGLLHDIGHLIMHQTIPDLSQQAETVAQETSQPIYKVERDLIGFDYASIGAHLMKQWSLPESLQEATMFHVEPEKAEKYSIEAALVHLGSLLTKAAEKNEVFNDGVLTADLSAWEISGLSPEDCTSLYNQIEEDAQEAMRTIFPKKG
ncbi:MAG: HDOD domain-containing protein, partial [Desulfobulbaceae bacterium]|nr:HDOD domain-containing protein [Desulfobulbaceae bacterium]